MFVSLPELGNPQLKKTITWRSAKPVKSWPQSSETQKAPVVKSLLAVLARAGGAIVIGCPASLKELRITQFGRGKWFRSPPSADRLNLICLPYAGGDGSQYYGWQEHLGKSVGVHPAHPPGHGSRFSEPLLGSMEEIVSSLLPSMPSFASGRYVILGASMGAWVGYELCQKLAGLGIRLPEALVVCGSSSPHDKIDEYKFANLRGAELLAELTRLNPEFTGAPESSELVQMMLPVLEADFALCEAWQPNLRAKLTLPIFGFCGDKDTFVSRSEMERWNLATEDKFHLEDISGSHFFVDEPPPTFFASLAGIFRSTAR